MSGDPIQRLVSAGANDLLGLARTVLHDVSLFGSDSPPCYCAGTMIRTEHGEVPVETLRAGNRVISVFGGTVPVAWLGYRHVQCRRHPRPQDVWPVRVCAGAFADGPPNADLWLSPDHAVFTDGVLIPVRHLINGATIVQEPVDEVTYWHVELPRHDVLCAAGLTCESYLDTGNRGAFENGSGENGRGPIMLHPDFALRVWQAEACAPLVLNGAELMATRSVLVERAQQLGHALTRDAALHLRVNGRQLPASVAGATHRFQLPHDATSIRLVSRHTTPALLRPHSDDHRQLGVAVSRLVLDGKPLPLSDARLGSGWHDLEHEGTGRRWRWTNGDAGLAIAGGRCLEVKIAMTERYWLTARPDAVRTA